MIKQKSPLHVCFPRTHLIAKLPIRQHLRVPLQRRYDTSSPVVIAIVIVFLPRAIMLFLDAARAVFGRHPRKEPRQRRITAAHHRVARQDGI